MDSGESGRRKGNGGPVPFLPSKESLLREMKRQAGKRPLAASAGASCRNPRFPSAASQKMLSRRGLGRGASTESLTYNTQGAPLGLPRQAGALRGAGQPNGAAESFPIGEGPRARRARGSELPPLRQDAMTQRFHGRFHLKRREGRWPLILPHTPSVDSVKHPHPVPQVGRCLLRGRQNLPDPLSAFEAEACAGLSRDRRPPSPLADTGRRGREAKGPEFAFPARRTALPDRERAKGGGETRSSM